MSTRQQEQALLTLAGYATNVTLVSPLTTGPNSRWCGDVNHSRASATTCTSDACQSACQYACMVTQQSLRSPQGRAATGAGTSPGRTRATMCTTLRTCAAAASRRSATTPTARATAPPGRRCRRRYTSAQKCRWGSEDGVKTSAPCAMAAFCCAEAPDPRLRGLFLPLGAAAAGQQLCLAPPPAGIAGEFAQ